MYVVVCTCLRTFASGEETGAPPPGAGAGLGDQSDAGGGSTDDDATDKDAYSDAEPMPPPSPHRERTVGGRYKLNAVAPELESALVIPNERLS
jgi:hypothetical protein